MPEILVTLYVEDTRPSLSKSGTWLASLQWAERMRPMLTPRAYAGLCLGVVAPRAVRSAVSRCGAAACTNAFGTARPTLAGRGVCRRMADARGAIDGTREYSLYISHALASRRNVRLAG